MIALPTVFDRNPTVQSDFEVLPEDLELIEKVGSGAYGQVWRGVWKGRGGGVDVAVKIVEALGRTEQQQAKAFGEVGILTPFSLWMHSYLCISFSPCFLFFVFCFLFFLTPLYILMRLKHPYIMTIYGTCTVQKQLWIVMKYIDGKSLFELLHSTEEISWEWRLRYTPNHWFKCFSNERRADITKEMTHQGERERLILRCRFARQAAISVNVLHSSRPSVLHRDLKSPNFMVSLDWTTLILIDFGVSKVSSHVSYDPRGGLLSNSFSIFSVFHFHWHNY